MCSRTYEYGQLLHGVHVCLPCEQHWTPARVQAWRQGDDWLQTDVSSDETLIGTESSGLSFPEAPSDQTGRNPALAPRTLRRKCQHYGSIRP